MSMRRLAAAFALLPALFLVAAPAALASPSDPEVTLSATENSQSYLIESCVSAKLSAAAARHELNQDDCRVTTTSRTGAASAVTAKDVESDRTLSLSQRSSLLQAVSSGAVYSKHFSWFTTAAAYTVTHNGTFYYNGWKAWVGEYFDGYQGYHSCFVNYSAGLTISPDVCSETGNDFERDLLYRWQVVWPWFSYGVEHTGHVYSNGTTS